MFIVEAEDGEDGSTLDADGEAVCGDFFDGGVCADVHEALGDDEVAGGGDGEVFGDAFDDAEEDCLPDFHGVKFSRGGWWCGGGWRARLKRRNGVGFVWIWGLNGGWVVRLWWGMLCE